MRTEVRSSTEGNKIQYAVINHNNEGDQNFLEFDTVEKSTQKDNIKHMLKKKVSKVIPRPDKKTRKSKVQRLGTRPLSGFRSSLSALGYHESTSPENFLKKKYLSEHLRKAQRKVLTGSLASVAKSELYQHIIAQYRKGGIKIKKKKLQRKKHKSKSDLFQIFK
jgi:hypothetical protein